ncbi:hypothetical protein [Risungbinella massiliensis]|uniref:hypothetical protein n=1 Tax=Risungbinella massiliensis TaxID=1329796 RepID=UPI0012B53CFC|nr:hypothetical protein [Risungbinella massiliensis]
MTQDHEQRIISETVPIHSEGASKERDEALHAKGTPLGEAVQVNKEKKVQGRNFPAT